MKWFNKWLLRSMRKAASEEGNQPMEAAPDKSYYGNSGQAIGLNTMGAIAKSSSSMDSSDKVIRFNVYSANGGRVVETRRMNRQRDQEITGLYVITSEQDFGHEVDKIITMEALK